MQEQVIVMSAEQYFKKYAVDGIGKGADRWMIKRQILDSFRKEIFGLVAMRTKKSCNDINTILVEGDPEARRITKNVIHDATRKWLKLCGMFSMYKETNGLLKEDDLKLYDEIGDLGKPLEDLEVKEEDENVGSGTETDQTDIGENAGRNEGNKQTEEDGNEEA